MVSRTDGTKGEIGFDTNWEFIESQMFFEDQSKITKVNFVGSHKCKILPKSLLLMDNGDLLVSSYASNGVKIRAYKTSPFVKISKYDYPISIKDPVITSK